MVAAAPSLRRNAQFLLEFMQAGCKIGHIGCGCLSLRSCKLFNPGDREAQTGSGPRILYRNMGDRS